MNNTQLFIGLVCFLLSSSSLLSQGTQVEFGKNRVQYHRDFDEWHDRDDVSLWYHSVVTGEGIGSKVVAVGV